MSLESDLIKLGRVAERMGWYTGVKYSPGRRLWTASVYDGDGVRLAAAQGRDPRQPTVTLLAVLKERHHV